MVIHSPRPHRRRRLLLATAITIGITAAALIVIGPPLVGAASHPAPTPAATRTTSSLETLPGFASVPSWTGDAAPASVVVSADGALIGQSFPDRVVVTNPSGQHRQVVPLKGAHLVAGSVSGREALIAVAGDQVEVVTATDMSGPLTIPSGSHLLVRSGGVLVMTTDNRPVGVLTRTGVTPYADPAEGVVPAGVLPDGAVQWVSVHGELYTTNAAGTGPAPTALASPAPGARVSHVLAGGSVIVTTWLLPDHSTVLTTHTPVGQLVGRSPVSEDPELLTSSNGRSAMTGAVRVDLRTGILSAPSSAFAATVALAHGTFFGGVAAGTAVQDDTGHTRQVPAPSISPVGGTSAGALVALLPTGRVAVFPIVSPSSR